MNHTSPSPPPRGRVARGLCPLALAAVIVAGAVACGGSDTSSRGTARSTRTVSAEPSASATPSRRTQQEFAASVSAKTERDRQRAVALLKGVEGPGNAVGDVSVTGLRVEPSERFRGALVRVTNKTDKDAFYAVRVEFIDASGKTLDSVVLGLEGVRAGDSVSEHANSRKAAGVKTFPRIAQAQRG